MARCLLLFCLILAHVFTPTLARILSDAHTFVQPRVERRDGPASDPPTSNGLAGEVGSDPPTSNEFAGEVGSDPPTSSNELAGKDEETAREPAESPESERLENDHRHHHQDGSVACGGAIVGGLATAAFAVVFCYIRVTRRRNAQVAA